MKFWPLIVLAVACVMVPAASANSITWDFATAPNASLGSTTHTYTAGGISIFATGSTNLYYKVGGGDETGLGLACCDSDHEINPGQSITLNLGGLFSKKITNLTLMLGSIQNGESGSVCDAFAHCMTFNSSSDFKPVKIMSLYADMKAHHSGQLIVTAGSGDVLINQLQATASTVPEPSSLLLMGSGLLAMTGVVRRKLRL
ncbi:MAG TPA: PEP-CTERM sorting domain-containing protein [Terriglobales bacterium]|nr:PEP-CTERM sorting domain-containing protein [Terriglobales bacterium]